MPSAPRVEGEDVVTWMCRMFEGARFRFDILDDCTLTDAQKVEKARALISEFAAALLAARREVRALRDALEWIDKEAPLEGLYAGGEGYLAFANRLKARALAALAATQEEK